MLVLVWWGLPALSFDHFIHTHQSELTMHANCSSMRELWVFSSFHHIHCPPSAHRPVTEGSGGKPNAAHQNLHETQLHCSHATRWCVHLLIISAKVNLNGDTFTYWSYMVKFIWMVMQFLADEHIEVHVNDDAFTCWLYGVEWWCVRRLTNILRNIGTAMRSRTAVHSEVLSTVRWSLCVE